jgi:hypothetical protein
VLSLSVFIEGDDHLVKSIGEIHQPDNVETTQSGLYITEDPGSSQQFPVGSTDPNATPARLWRHSFATGLDAPVAVVNQSADEGPTDVDSSTAPGAQGSWESTGIVDASSVFGPGAFLINVQAHTLWIEQSAAADWTNEREGGQLMLLRIPGA